MGDTDITDLDPQEAIEAGYDATTDIDTEAEVAEAVTPEDEQYTPEPLDRGQAAFDLDGWPGDELVIADLDGIDESEEETD